MPRISKFWNITNCGRKKTCVGTTIVTRTKANNMPIPLNRSLAKAYPAKAALINCKIIIDEMKNIVKPSVRM
jgi:hypothetical protein